MSAEIPRWPQVGQRFQEILSSIAEWRRRGAMPSDAELKAQYPDEWSDLEPELAKLRQIEDALDRVEASRLRRILESSLDEESPTGSRRDSDARTGDLADAFQAAGSPAQFGRFQVQRLLGEGGFGRVYLAWDDELTRHVAIKVPHECRLQGPQDVRVFLSEARLVATLDHPAIVPVYDVGRTGDGGCYVISKWIQGTSLALRMREQRFSPKEAARIACRVAEALAYAHQRGIVHRDIKPANILLDHAGIPFVTDFGLAIREEELGRGLPIAGTPSYMSPELARGEGHRIDGRSDLFSLGVVLYELLTGQRPFESSQPEQLLEQIIHGDVRPPRQLNAGIPAELERICLKALAKRAADRYAGAKDLSVDLLDFLATAGDEPARTMAADKPNLPTTVAAQTTPRKFVPKGLRPFDANDAAFFLDLLPGPRDREGMPESLRQWKTKIEEFDPDDTFSVGLIYGPSGCGKSSLVRAGLLPRLAPCVTSVYVEAAADDTEARLLRRLTKKYPSLANQRSLTNCLVELRRGPWIGEGRKLLLVIDQFEQWLHGRTDEGRESLVEALRHCDGEHVQCLLLVRDDFWLSVSRFMDELEIQLVQGHNTALVDLFDVQHARKVLAEIGRAFARIPADPAQLGAAESAFLERAVATLSEDGRVISVRLALFAEMVKDRAWSFGTLQEVGGAAGLGVAFLEEMFCAPAANPQRRMHERAARAVLESLLPDSGSNIKGHVRSYPDLLDVSGYGRDPRAFKELMRILDSETRLLTPTDPPSSDAVDRGATPGVRYYQLTHDYLVPSLRSWLTKRQLSTRGGRAELRLAERSRLWNARPEGRQLPSVWEWLTIQLLTRSEHWSHPQRRMMKVAGRRHATVLSTISLLILAFLMVGTEVTTLVKDLSVWLRASTASLWLAFGQEESIWPLLQRTPDPTLRTQLIHGLSSLLVKPDELVKRQADESDVSIRRAMVLAAGQMGSDPTSDRDTSLGLRRTEASQELTGRLVELYRNDTDPGIHAAAEWALRRYKKTEEIEQVDRKPSRRNPDRQWYTTATGHTMVVIPAPVQYLMGSSVGERDSTDDEAPRAVHIRRSFSIANKETTVEQFQKFLARGWAADTAAEAPRASLTWYQAAAYCNWLSSQEGIPEKQWCYIPNERGEYAAGMLVAPDFPDLQGYRLPTEAEWEYACRAGAATAWFFGRSEAYLNEYLVGASPSLIQPLETGRRKPNDFGLFDMLGNVAEWCHDRYQKRTDRDSTPPELDAPESIKDQDYHVVRGGSFRDLAANLRCATRSRLAAGDTSPEIGFRVARSYP